MIESQSGPKKVVLNKQNANSDLTDEEYDALDEYYTKNPLKLSGNGKSGFFAKHAEKGNTVIFIDDLSANWLRIKAEATNTTRK